MMLAGLHIYHVHISLFRMSEVSETSHLHLSALKSSISCIHCHKSYLLLYTSDTHIHTAGKTPLVRQFVKLLMFNISIDDVPKFFMTRYDRLIR